MKNAKLVAVVAAFILAVGAILFYWKLSQGPLPKGQPFSHAGWTVTPPPDWDIGHHKAIKAIIMAPNLETAKPEEGDVTVTVHYEAKTWPYERVEEAMEELRMNEDTSEVEVQDIAGRNWLLSKRVNNLGTSYFARTIVGYKQYAFVRGDGEQSRGPWLEVLEKIVVPWTTPEPPAEEAPAEEAAPAEGSGEAQY